MTTPASVQPNSLRRLNATVRARVDWDALVTLGFLEPGTDPSDLLGLTADTGTDTVFVVADTGTRLDVDGVEDRVRRIVGTRILADRPHTAPAR